jgi:hypothetical protein
MENKLPFHNLSNKHVGVTPELGECYTQAARVCLDRHYSSPVEFIISDSNERRKTIAEWKQTDERIKAAWANEIDTTEFGAYACTLAAIDLTRGMVAIRRAETQTGADYYVCPFGMNFNDLENCFRLEVSGLDHGNESAVKQRLKNKIQQALNGANNLPAIAAVVSFKEKLILIKDVEQE